MWAVLVVRVCGSGVKNVAFIRGVLAKCESLRNGVVAYAHEEKNSTGTYRWTEVCVSDLDMYFNDQRFKALTRAWHTVALKKRFKLIFCYCNPKEKRLAELAEKDNLIMNI